MQDKLVEEAFKYDFWLGVVVILVCSNLGALLFFAKYCLERIQKERDKNDQLRTNYETQQREDLKLFMEVERLLSDFQGGEIRRLVEEIRIKVEQLMFIQQSSRENQK